jgi:hypothetical protein
MLDRRAFLRRSAAACALAALHPGALRAAPGAGALRLLVAAPPGAEALRLGARFGLEEVEQAAALLGREVVVQITETEPALEAVRRGGSLVVVGAGRGEDSSALAAAAAEAGLLHLNAADPSEALRAACFPTTFHVAPGAGMVEAARVLAGGTPGEILPWHHTLSRFGATQLNDRYLVRFGEPMPAAAWGVWMATKIAWEGAMRARTTSGSALAGHLRAARTRFDGHKGAPLTFRTDGQLRQPLYLVAPGAGGEEPVQLPDLRGAASPDDALDALHPGAPAC